MTNAWFLLALSAFTAGDWTSTDSFTNVIPARYAEHTVLALGRESHKSERSFLFYLRDEETGQWKAAHDYGVLLTGLIRHENSLYALGPFGSAVYGLDGTPMRNMRVHWKPDWVPLCSAVADGELYAFGRTQTSIEVARLEGDAWAEQPHLSLPQESGPAQMAAVETDGNTQEIFWISGESIIHAQFDATGWRLNENLPLPKGSNRLAAFRRSNQIHLFAANTSKRIHEQNPLYHVAIKTGSESGLIDWRPVQNLIDDPLFPTRYFAAAHAEGKDQLFLVNAARFETVDVEDGAASERLILAELPVLQNALRIFIIAAAIAALYLLAFILSVRRARHFPRIIEGEGHQIRLASWIRRGAAFIIDMSIFAIFLMVLSLVEGGSRLLEHLSALSMGSVIMIPYFVLLEADRGQSIGKRILGIAVVTVDLAPPTLKHVIIRNIFRLIPPAIGLLVLLNTRTSQRIGDIFAGTFVIELPDRKSLGQSKRN